MIAFRLPTITPRVWLYVAAALLLSLAYYAAYSHGKTVGGQAEQVHVLDSLNAVNTKQTVVDSAKVAAAETVSSAAVALSNHQLVTRTVVRTKVAVSGDSVNGEASPEVAHLIVADDSLISQQQFTIKAQTITLALKDTLIRDLRIGIDTRDKEIVTLKQMKMPRFGIKTGFAIGVAVALTVVHFAR